MMGLYRLLLAFAVVLAHTNPIPGLPMIGGGLAVKLFFVVSGFYMGLILSDRYANATRAFYLNRFLRLYPLFWIALALELLRGLVFSVVLDQPPGWWMAIKLVSDEGGFTWLLSYVSAQTSLIGIDFLHLFSWEESAGAVWHHAMEAQQHYTRGWKPLPMSHAWTLSCEILFYSLAPIIVRRSTLLLSFVCLLATGLNLVLPSGVEPQLASVASSFFGPLQFGYFIWGILSFRFYRFVAELYNRRVPRCILAAFAMISLFATPALQNISYTGGLLLFWCVCFLGIPALFVLSQTSSVDRFLGEFSYPVYLVHITCIPLVMLMAPQLGINQYSADWILPVATMAMSMLLALGLIKCMAKLVDRRRDKIRAEAANAGV